MSETKGAPRARSVDDAQLWHQIVIAVPDLCFGKTLARFTEQLLGDPALNVRQVVVASIEGAGDPDRGVTQLRCGRISIPELLSRLLYSEQLDWGNLFFFDDVNDSAVERICGEFSLSQAIAISSIAIRIVDDSEIHVFTRNDRVQRSLTDRFANTRARTGPLGSLEFPN